MVIKIEMFKYCFYLLIKMEEQKEGQSVFVEYFGDYPLVRVLDFLIDGRDMDYSMTEIAKNSNIGRTAFSEIWPQLIKRNIVLFTRKVGNARLYRLNIQNQRVKELIKMDNLITKLETNRLLKEKELAA